MTTLAASRLLAPRALVTALRRAPSALPRTFAAAPAPAPSPAPSPAPAPAPAAAPAPAPAPAVAPVVLAQGNIANMMRARPVLNMLSLGEAHLLRLSKRHKP